MLGRFYHYYPQYYYETLYMLPCCHSCKQYIYILPALIFLYIYHITLNCLHLLCLSACVLCQCRLPSWGWMERVGIGWSRYLWHLLHLFWTIFDDSISWLFILKQYCVCYSVDCILICGCYVAGWPWRKKKNIIFDSLYLIIYQDI